MENETIETLEKVTDEVVETVDPIYEKLLEHGTTADIQEYLDVKRKAVDKEGTIDVLTGANENLRKEIGRLTVELRETRRALNGAIPSVIEVVKEVKPPQSILEPEITNKELEVEEIINFFEGK